jgi:hypothetical protein
VCRPWLKPRNPQTRTTHTHEMSDRAAGGGDKGAGGGGGGGKGAGELTSEQLAAKEAKIAALRKQLADAEQGLSCVLRALSCSACRRGVVSCVLRPACSARCRVLCPASCVQCEVSCPASCVLRAVRGVVQCADNFSVPVRR